MIVYLCGGINGLSDADAENWREAAKALLTAETLDPMRRDYRGHEAENVAAIVEGDLQDVVACDVVLVNAVRPSWGTAMEVVYAKTWGKRIVAFTGGSRVSPWVSYHCECVYSFQDAIDRINGVKFVRITERRPNG